MIIKADVKGLEVVVAAELSGDEVLCQEIINKVDIHDANRLAFKLGEGKPGRLVAKIFKFRLIYGGSAYSYANDSDFQGVSRSQKFWQDVIDQYYAKYKGIQRWHQQLLREAQSNGRLEIPSGRFYPIVPDYSKTEPWPLTIIKNYPVQGFGADLVMLARLQAKKLIRESGLEAKMIFTTHDDLGVDTPEKNVQAVGQILSQSILDVPKLCKQVFNYDFKLPLTSEIQYGQNKLEMKNLTII